MIAVLDSDTSYNPKPPLLLTMSERSVIKFNSFLGASTVIFFLTTIFTSGIAVQKLDQLVQLAAQQARWNERIEERIRAIEQRNHLINGNDDSRRYQGYKDAQ